MTASSMFRSAALAGVLAVAGGLALAPADVRAQSALVASSCGSASLTATNIIGYFYVDTTGKLCVNVGTLSVGSVGSTGSAVPSSGDYQGINVAGTLRGWTGVNPSGSIYAGQVDLSSLAGTVLGAPSNYGTSPGAVAVQGVNAYITNVPAVSQSGSWTVAATQSGNWTSRIVGNAGAVFDFAGQNASSPANALLAGCQFNTSPTTITTGNASPLQCDNGGKVLVNPGTVTVTATNLQTNLNQVAGASVATGHGTASGALRVELPTDGTGLLSAAQSGTWTVQPGNTANTTPWLAKVGDGTNAAAIKAASTAPVATDPALVVAISPNSVNANGQATMANSSPVVIASNQSAVPVKLQDSAGTGYIVDPCQVAAKTNVAISQTANTKLFSQVSAKKNYICSIVLVGADAENVSLVEGTGSTCGTSTAAIIGGTTAANGPNLAANGGFAVGNGGFTVAAGGNANYDVCLFQSGSGRVAGVLTYVQN